MIENDTGTKRKNAARTDGWSHGIVPESCGGDLLTVLEDDPARMLGIPLRIAQSDHPRGFHHEGSMVYCGYWEDGMLWDVQDTLRGKCLYPPKVVEPPMVGRYDDLRVYFIAADIGQIKIGIAAEPEARVRSLQTGSPVKLRLLCHCEGGRPQERDYHSRFAEHRLHGEWFTPHPDILAEIERLTNAV